MSEFPWAQTKFGKKPSGLCDCVARVQYMTPTEARELANVQKTDLLHRVARWRVQQPEQFDDLVRLITRTKELKAA